MIFMYLLMMAIHLVLVPCPWTSWWPEQQGSGMLAVRWSDQPVQSSLLEHQSARLIVASSKS